MAEQYKYIDKKLTASASLKSEVLTPESMREGLAEMVAHKNANPDQQVFWAKDEDVQIEVQKNDSSAQILERLQEQGKAAFRRGSPLERKVDRGDPTR